MTEKLVNYITKKKTDKHVKLNEFHADETIIIAFVSLFESVSKVINQIINVH